MFLDPCFFCSLVFKQRNCFYDSGQELGGNEFWLGAIRAFVSGGVMMFRLIS
jgi:hypothetical protein